MNATGRARAANLESPWFEEYYLADSLPEYQYDPVYAAWEALMEEHTKLSGMAPVGAGKSELLNLWGVAEAA